MRSRIIFLVILIVISSQSLFAAPKRIKAQSHSGCAYEVIFTGGTADAYALPTEGRHPSPGLANYLFTRNPKDYDDPAVNRHFGDSFKLDACVICNQLCSAKLLIELQGNDSLACNDTIFIGRAGGTALFSGPLNPSGCPTTPDDPNHNLISWFEIVSDSLSRTIVLDEKQLQDLVCVEGYEWLDVIVQDDHTVDSMRLVVEY